MTSRGLKGGPELLAFLDAFPKRLQNNAVKSGLRAAAAPPRDDARIRARKKSGKTAKSIKTGSPRVNEDGSISIRVRYDPKSKLAFVGRLQETGVRPHLIKAHDNDRPTRTRRDGREEAVSMKKLNQMVHAGSLVIGKNFVGPVVHHPGHSAQPALAPALEAKAGEAVNAMGMKIREYLSTRAGFTAPVTLSADDE
jgi:hypothetical protein